MTALTDTRQALLDEANLIAAWALNLWDDDISRQHMNDIADRLRTIAATLPGPYSPQPPTVEGWYWWRDAYGVETMLKVYCWTRGCVPLLMVASPQDYGTDEPVDGFGGEWSGPIPQPPKGQV